MGLMLPLRGYHWVALLVVCLVLDTVTAVQLPGVAWSKLEIWEASAFADVWSRPKEYLEYKTHLCNTGYIWLHRVC